MLFDGQRRRFDINLLDDAWMGRVGRKVPPQPGQALSVWVSNPVTCSGGKGWRVCLS